MWYGDIGYATLFTIILGIVLIVLDSINFGKTKGKSVNLKITIPEDLNYDGVFDEVLEKYCNKWTLEKIRTRDFGALYELNYQLNLHTDTNQKKLIDDLRVRNGNLNI